MRAGIDDNLWRRKRGRMTSVQQVEQMVRIADEPGHERAAGLDARRLDQIRSIDEVLPMLELPPNRGPGQRGLPMRLAA